MAYIVSYQKFITRDITKLLDAPEDATELCTIDGTTYVSIHADTELSDDQPTEIADSIETVVLTNELRELIKSHSTHVQLINERVKDKIAERYSITDELKEIRNSSSASFSDYADYVEECRQWGRDQKALLGLAPEGSIHLRALTRRQFKLVLMENDLLESISSAIAGIDDAALKARIEIEYSEATEFVRTSDSVSYMAGLLGLTNEQLDAMWSQALAL
jgi:vacuolar-type H+-ATPase subunit F/Vma7